MAKRRLSSIAVASMGLMFGSLGGYIAGRGGIASPWHEIGTLAFVFGGLATMTLCGYTDRRNGA